MCSAYKTRCQDVGRIKIKRKFHRLVFSELWNIKHLDGLEDHLVKIQELEDYVCLEWGLECYLISQGRI